MRKRSIGSDRYIVSLNNKYYVVNDYTYKLLSEYNNDNGITYLSKSLNISKKDTKRVYSQLQKELSSTDYYEDNINLDFPLKVQWKITNKCNLKCKHCYLGKLNQQELEEKQILDIAKKICDSNIMEVTITGGEALLVNNLPEIVNMLIKSDIRVNIFTNAILLDNFIERLYHRLKYHPTNKLYFYISIDGKEKSHDLIRGKGNFKKTIDNVRKLINLGYKVTTNTVLSTLNYQEVPDLYKYLYDLGVNKIQISNLIDDGNATSDMKLTSTQKELFIENLKSVLEKLNDDSKLLYAEMPDEVDNQSKVFLIDKKNKTFLEKEKWKCSAGIGKATINYNGEVYCCPFITKYSLGNITKKSLEEIWSSKNRFKFLELIAKQNNNSRVCIAVKSRKEKEVK